MSEIEAFCVYRHALVGRGVSERDCFGVCPWSVD